jgi:hypothetical protein
MIYIISQLSTDLHAVIDYYERYSDIDDITILTWRSENYKFLISCKLRKANIRQIHFENAGSKQINRFTRLIKRKILEKKQIDQISAEIRQSMDNKVVFHALNSDPAAAYLVTSIAKKNPVIYVDVLHLTSQKLKFSDLLSMEGIKNIIYMYIVTFIFFGTKFYLGGTSKHQYLTFDLSRIIFKNLSINKYDFKNKPPTKYQYKLTGSRIALVLYSDPFGVDIMDQETCYQNVLKILFENDFQVYIKHHPQSIRSTEFDGVAQIPKHIPFEFLDTENISLILGCFSAAMASIRQTDTISIAKLLYAEHSPYFIEGARQLASNPELTYVSSLDNLRNYLKKSTQYNNLN